MRTRSNIWVGKVTAVLFAVIMCASVPAYSGPIDYKTGFEPPVFQPGPLNGQDGWEHPQKTASISVQSPISGQQSIEVDGADLPPLGGGWIGTRFGRFSIYDPISGHTPVIDASVDVQLAGPSSDTGQGPADDLISANLDFFGTDSESNPLLLGSLMLSSSGEVWVFGSRSQDAYAAGVPIKLSAPHRLKVRADFSTRRTQYFVDGKRVEFLIKGKRSATLPFGPEMRDAIFAGGFLSVFAVDDPQLDPALYTARYDNYSVTALVPVAFDIKPGSCPNRLDVESTRVLPAAVLGSKALDVSKIDPQTLRLMVGQRPKKGIAPLKWAVQDVATPYKPYLGKVNSSDCSDSGPDGYNDLTVRFKLDAVADYLLALKDGTVIVLTITGKMKPEFGGAAFTGEDVALIVNKS